MQFYVQLYILSSASLQSSLMESSCLMLSTESSLVTSTWSDQNSFQRVSEETLRKGMSAKNCQAPSLWYKQHFMYTYSVISGRRGGLVVCMLDSRSDREVWVWALAGSLCCVLGQDTLLSKCLSPPRSINGFQQTAGETWWNAGGLPAMDYHPIQEE